MESVGNEVCRGRDGEKYTNIFYSDSTEKFLEIFTKAYNENGYYFGETRYTYINVVRYV